MLWSKYHRTVRQLNKTDLGTHVHREKEWKEILLQILTNDYLWVLELAIICIFFFILKYIYSKLKQE